VTSVFSVFSATDGFCLLHDFPQRDEHLFARRRRHYQSTHKYPGNQPLAGAARSPAITRVAMPGGRIASLSNRPASNFSVMLDTKLSRLTQACSCPTKPFSLPN
jgi:hypothetical protein